MTDMNALNGGFAMSLPDFIEQVRTFDMSFKLDDMFQSLRNVWIMNCIRYYGHEHQDHAVDFAYSMLYPYTDNFLDTDGVSETQKQGTNDKLEKGWPVKLSDRKRPLRTGCSGWWR